MQNLALQKFFTALTAQEQHEFADRCGTTSGQIKQVMYGHRNCNPALAIAIDRESKGVVKCDSLCPQADYEYIRSQAVLAAKLI